MNNWQALGTGAADDEDCLQIGCLHFISFDLELCSLFIARGLLGASFISHKIISPR